MSCGYFKSSNFGTNPSSDETLSEIPFRKIAQGK